MSLTVFSFGGGVQSTAALVLAAQGQLHVDAFVFANVGDDSENPATLAYIRDYARPYAEAHGLRLVEVCKVRRDGSHRTLYQHVLSDARSIPIPVRMANGAPGRRACTEEYKINPVATWTYRQGARATNPAILQLGISTNELWRMRNDSGKSYLRLAYPLVDLGISRAMCHGIIAGAGLPPCRKSSCWYCPFQTVAKWAKRRRDEPDVFWRGVDFERLVNVKRKRLGKDPVYLTSAGRPLDQITSDTAQLDLFPAEDEEYSCGPFVCHTIDREVSA